MGPPEAGISIAQRGFLWPRHSRRHRQVSKKDQRKDKDDEYYDYDDDDEDDEKESTTTTTARPTKRRDRRPSARGRLISVGSWRPREGLILHDKLFPHISHGFRNRTLPVISVHVSGREIFHTGYQKRCFRDSTFFFLPEPALANHFS